MTPEYWEKLQNLFNRAITLEGDEQALFIEQQCLKDSLLKDELMSMLKHDSHQSSPRQIVFQAAAEMSEDEDDYWIGQELGQYRINQLIAQGGMGAVYLGERIDQVYQQKVAIKLLASDLVSKQAKKRFKRERQILANLNHPDIANLIDGGTSDSGTPFLIMEYFQGVPIDQHCHQHKLSLRARIELVIKVCDAVHYAHQNLVVHRDIKPGNILVNENGDLKLLDFGIAKILEAQDYSGANLEAADIALTRADMRILTPETASPEQVVGNSVTTATDVYGIGTLLTKLLTGQYPFDVTSRGLPQLEKLICEQTPPTLSKLIARISPQAAREEFGESQKKLISLVKGDLENVVAKALRKDPQKRYLSTKQLAYDLENYLNHRTVSARPAGFIEKLVKLFRRHPVAAWATTAASILFIAVVSVYTWQLKIQRDITQLQLKKSQEISRFLVDSFKVSDPIESLGNTITARQILDRGATRIKTELAGQQELQANLSQTIGQVYLSLGILSQAEPLLDEALLIKTSLYGEGDPLLIPDILALSELYHLRGELNKSEEGLRRALSISLGSQGESHLQSADIKVRLASLLREKSLYLKSSELLQQAKIVQIQILGELSPEVFQTERELYLLNADLGEFSTAVSIAEQLNRKLVTYYGELHPEVARNMSDWGYVLMQSGQYVEAKALFLKAYQIDTEIYGEEHHVVVEDLLDLGAIYELMEDYSESVEALEKVIALGSELMSDNHPLVAVAYNDLANVEKKLGLFEKSEAHYLKSIDINIFLFGRQHPEVATNYSNFGLFLSGVGKNDLAEKYLRESLAMRREIFGNTHPHIGFGLSTLGTHLFKMGEFEEARDYFSRSLEMKKIYFKEASREIASAQVRLARSLVELGDFDSGEAMLKEAVTNIEATGETNTRWFVMVYSEMGLFLANRERCKEALPYLERTASVTRNIYSDDAPVSNRTHKAISECLESLSSQKK